MKELITKYLAYIEENISVCEKRCLELKAEERSDEGNLEKVKGNIYTIFKAILVATEKQITSVCYTNEQAAYEAFCQSFLQKFDTIPSSWKLNLEKAKKFEDTVTQVIEETKLAVADKMKETFTTYCLATTDERKG